VRGPVERAEKRARRHGGVGGPQLAALDSVGDDGAHAALVAIAFGDDRRAQARRQGIHLEVRGRPLDFVQQAQHVRGRHVVQPIGRARVAARDRLELAHGALERAVEEAREQLLLGADVVVQASFQQADGFGDVADARAVIALLAEHPGSRGEDLILAGARRSDSGGHPST